MLKQFFKTVTGILFGLLLALGFLYFVFDIAHNADSNVLTEIQCRTKIDTQELIDFCKWVVDGKVVTIDNRIVCEDKDKYLYKSAETPVWDKYVEDSKVEIDTWMWQKQRSTS